MITGSSMGAGISGICKLNEKLVILLDIFQAFTTAEQRTLAEVEK